MSEELALILVLIVMLIITVALIYFGIKENGIWYMFFGGWLSSSFFGILNSKW